LFCRSAEDFGVEMDSAAIDVTCAREQGHRDATHPEQRERDELAHEDVEAGQRVGADQCNHPCRVGVQSCRHTIKRTAVHKIVRK